MNAEIIDELHKRVAKMLGHEVRAVDIAFVPLIERKETYKNGVHHSYEIRGRCYPNEGKIEIVPTPNWGVTLIEELIHLYHPEWRHPKVKNCVRNCVHYLKIQVDNPSKFV